MKLMKHLNLSAQHLQDALHHLPWQDAPSEQEPNGSFVLAVALVSLAAAAVLILAP
ncbi:MAG: hypothetical protein ABW005_07735 [Burkholderiaceae bacterium]